MNNELNLFIEEACKNPMTDEELTEQAISFALGQSILND